MVNYERFKSNILDAYCESVKCGECICGKSSCPVYNKERQCPNTKEDCKAQIMAFVEQSDIDGMEKKNFVSASHTIARLPKDNTSLVITTKKAKKKKEEFKELELSVIPNGDYKQIKVFKIGYVQAHQIAELFKDIYSFIPFPKKQFEPVFSKVEEKVGEHRFGKIWLNIDGIVYDGIDTITQLVATLKLHGGHQISIKVCDPSIDKTLLQKTLECEFCGARVHTEEVPF